MIASVTDPHHLDADPDTNPDPTYYFDADPDADPDPFYLLWIRILSLFDVDPDMYPSFQIMA